MSEIIFVAPARFVTLPLAEKCIGLTVKAMERKIERGVWAEGIQYRRRDGGIFVDLRRFEQWVDKGQA